MTLSLFDKALIRASDTPDNSGLVWKSIAVRGVDAKQRSVNVVASTAAIDSHGDIIEQSWDLERFAQNPVVLFAHDNRSLPIGSASEVGVVDGELRATINFVDAKANPLAEQVFESFKQGSLRAVSVGFVPGDVSVKEVAGEHVFVLSRNVLHEISAVPIPSNPETLARMHERALAAHKTNPAPSRDKAAESGERTQKMDHEKALAEANTRIANVTAELDTERSKSAALQTRCDDLDAELKGTRETVNKLAGDLVDKELNELVGSKLSAAEVPGIKKLAELDRTVYEAQLEAIRARPDLPQAKSNVLSDPPVEARAAAPTHNDNTATVGGTGLAARIEASNAS